MPAFLLENPRAPGTWRATVHGVATELERTGRPLGSKGGKASDGGKEGVRRTGLNRIFFLQAEGGGGDRKVSQLSLDSVAREQFAGSGTQPSLTPADAQQVFPTLGVGAGVGYVCVEL